MNRFIRTALVAVSIALLIWVFGRKVVFGQDESQDVGAGDPALVSRAIRRVQPFISDQRADHLAGIIVDACDEHTVPPLLVVSLVMHESSFARSVERRDRLGQAGEIGLMQLMPAGPWRRHLPEGCTEELVGARCQIGAGVAWLAECRRRCPGSPYRWVAAYGMARCVPEHDAGMLPWVRRRIRMFVDLGGTW